jgi:DNA-directed RNA polymerase specialized sigma24 family protein
MPDGRFPPTRGSVLEAARSERPEERERALETLAAAYWRPVYVTLRLKWHREHEEACDLTQSFFVHLVETKVLERFDPSRGRLRTYLRACLDALVANETKAASRLRRGGGAVFVSLDVEALRLEADAVSAAEVPSPEELFTREWVQGVFAAAVERARRGLTAEGKGAWFELFRRYDIEEDGLSVLSYADLARELGMKETDVTNRLVAVRRRFRAAALAVLREMTATDEEFRREVRTLLGTEPP